MKLTPQLTIDTIDIMRNETLWNNWTNVEQARDCLEASVLFSFGSLRPSHEHITFALDLYERDLFRLPYPVTAFHSKVDGKESLLLLSQHPTNNLLAAMMITQLTADSMVPNGAVPLLLIRDDMPTPLRTPPPGHRAASVIQYLSDAANKQMLGDDYFREMCNGTDALAVECMGYVAMMMSKGVDTTHVPEPVKLNKARLKRRKSPIREHYVVTVDLKKYVRHADGGHTRGSPCPHWRRGHIRRWETNTGETRLIPIAPTLVAVRDDSPVVKPTYRAKG